MQNAMTEASLPLRTARRHERGDHRRYLVVIGHVHCRRLALVIRVPRRSLGSAQAADVAQGVVLWHVDLSALHAGLIIPLVWADCMAVDRAVHEGATTSTLLCRVNRHKAAVHQTADYGIRVGHAQAAVLRFVARHEVVGDTLHGIRVALQGTLR